jgi:hypothetical protein
MTGFVRRAPVLATEQRRTKILAFGRANQFRMAAVFEYLNSSFTQATRD